MKKTQLYLLFLILCISLIILASAVQSEDFAKGKLKKDKQVDVKENKIIEKAGKAKINFKNSFNVSVEDVDDSPNVYFSDNVVSVNTKELPELNQPATITLYDVDSETLPIIYYNEEFTTNPDEIKEQCPEDICYNIDYDKEAKTISFDVAHFSSYKIGEGSWPVKNSKNIQYTGKSLTIGLPYGMYYDSWQYYFYPLYDYAACPFTYPFSWTAYQNCLDSNILLPKCTQGSQIADDGIISYFPQGHSKLWGHLYVSDDDEYQFTTGSYYPYCCTYRSECFTAPDASAVYVDGSLAYTNEKTGGSGTPPCKDSLSSFSGPEETRDWPGSSYGVNCMRDINSIFLTKGFHQINAEAYSSYNYYGGYNLYVWKDYYPGISSPYTPPHAILYKLDDIKGSFETEWYNLAQDYIGKVELKNLTVNATFNYGTIEVILYINDTIKNIQTALTYSFSSSSGQPEVQTIYFPAKTAATKVRYSVTLKAEDPLTDIKNVPVLHKIDIGYNQLNLNILSIKPIQVLQDAPLVADKKLAVRVDVGLESPDMDVVEDVTVKLEYAGREDSLTQDVRKKKPIGPNTPFSEIQNIQKCGDAFVFYVNPSLPEGKYTFKAIVDYSDNIAETNEQDNEKSITSESKKTHGLLIYAFPVSLLGNLPANPSGFIQNEVMFIDDTYPTPDNGVSLIYDSAPLDATSHGSTVNGIYEQMSLAAAVNKRGALLFNNMFNSKLVRFVGILPHDSITLHSNPVCGVWYPTSPNAVLVDETCEATTAHEIGHSYGLWSDFWGKVLREGEEYEAYPDEEGIKVYNTNIYRKYFIDQGLQAGCQYLLPNFNEKMCFMGASIPYAGTWIDHGDYYAFGNSLFKEFTKPLQDPNLLLISGTLYNNLTISLGPFYPLGDGIVDPKDYSYGGLSVESVTNDGVMLSKANLNAEVSNLNQMPFSMVINFPANADKLVFSYKSNVLKELTKSQNAPVVKILTNKGDKLLWEGNDSDNDKLVYLLYYSKGSNSNWTLLDYDVADSQYILDPNIFENNQKYFFRIEASDNFNKGSDIVEFTFLNDITPPTISLSVSPAVVWPPNNKPVDVTVSGTITDDISGVNQDLITLVIDGIKKEMSLDSSGGFNLVAPLMASRLGTDKYGRYYFINLTASDNVGNKATKTAVVVVSHDWSLENVNEAAKLSASMNAKFKRCTDYAEAEQGAKVDSYSSVLNWSSSNPEWYVNPAVLLGDFSHILPNRDNSFMFGDNDFNQWLIIDLGQERSINKLESRHSGYLWDRYVWEFVRISASLDKINWDEWGIAGPYEEEGNMQPVVTITRPSPLSARYIKYEYGKNTNYPWGYTGSRVFGDGVDASLCQ